MSDGKITDIPTKLRYWNYSRADKAKVALEAADEIERLREQHRQHVKLLDDQLGHPCTVIKMQQEIDELRGLLILAKKYAAQLDVVGGSGAIRCYESDMKAFNEALYGEKEKEDVGKTETSESRSAD